jgi:nucleotide-binding universal stress UspA family protein
MSLAVPSRSIAYRMSIDLIVSYDGTETDDDALALGSLLARGGVTLALAYVRHSREFDPRREALAQHDAERRLEQGARWLEEPDVTRYILLSASTAEALAQLAAAEEASVIVFGSDYRTSPGHAEPGTTAQHLLEGGTTAIAVAAAGLRAATDSEVRSIALADDDPAAAETADSLAENLGASIVALGNGPVDLIVAGSGPYAQPGRIALSGSTRSILNAAHGSVLIVPHEKPVLL